MAPLYATLATLATLALTAAVIHLLRRARNRLHRLSDHRTVGDYLPRPHRPAPPT